MKNLLLIILFFAGLQVCLGQKKFASSCTAPDSIKARYKDDADRLALRKVYNTGSQYLDSSTIPKFWSDTIMRALMAVYNVDSIPSRDTVIDITKIHSFPKPVLNRFYMGADSTIPWMQKLKENVFPTGHDSVDFLMKYYKINVLRYYIVNTQPYHIIVFESKGNYNFDVISNQFDKLGNVHYANRYSYSGDGNDIQATIDTAYVELVYSLGWNNCLTSCDNRRYYKFRVFYDCSVQYLGSYGSKLSAGAIHKISNDHVAIYPNPFTHQITIANLKSEGEYKIYNSYGQLLQRGTTSQSSITNLDALPSGMYWLHLETDHDLIRYKLLKE